MHRKNIPLMRCMADTMVKGWPRSGRVWLACTLLSSSTAVMLVTLVTLVTCVTLVTAVTLLVTTSLVSGHTAPCPSLTLSSGRNGLERLSVRG